MQTNIHAYKHKYTQIHICKHTYIQTNTRTYIQTKELTYKHIHIHDTKKNINKKHT